MYINFFIEKNKQTNKQTNKRKNNFFKKIVPVYLFLILIFYHDCIIIYTED